MIVLFNSPPGGGKDESARYLESQSWGVQKEFKEKLFEIALAVSGLEEEYWWTIYTAPRDSKLNKETPLHQLGGLSQRQLLVKISEEWIKPVFGERYFGECAVSSILHTYRFLHPSQNIFFSDSGFLPEARVLQEEFGKENVMLVRLYRDGCNYDGDSRQYLQPEDFELTIDLYNNGSLESLYSSLDTFVVPHLTKENDEWR